MEDLSLVPGPSAFITCSTKFTQRAWARSSRDVCHRHHFTSHQISQNRCRDNHKRDGWIDSWREGGMDRREEGGNRNDYSYGLTFSPVGKLLKLLPLATRDHG